ncbi:RNA helicase [Entamoeba marina]
MRSSGVGRSNELIITEDEEVQIVVRKVVPNFMKGMQGRLAQSNVVVPVKDQTADIARLARTGSEVKRKEIRNVRASLPIADKKQQLINVIRENQAVIVVGETGSGKTTQIAQYLYESGFGKKGIIGCTQPRRVAAVSVAQRVSEEVGCKVGDIVGYSIRFEEVTKTLSDPTLENYSVIIMDEAHERSLNTDILFGVFKKILMDRTDLRLVITSATIDEQKLSSFLVIFLTFPVKLQYLKASPSDYIDTAVKQILSIHLHHDEGDILVFMTGQEDIEVTCDLVPPLEILPIYSQLAPDAQQKIFKPSKLRKVVVATNIAETSLTVHGVKYVIDTGLGKWKVYNPKIGMDALQIFPVSKQNAEQRKGRAGRTQPGICYRMYTESTFNHDLLDSPVPEIQRTNLSNTILQLKAIGVDDVLKFELLDSPTHEALLNSLYELWVLSAIDENAKLTSLGTQMVTLPLDPALSKMLISAHTFNCTTEALTIAAMLTVPNVFIRPRQMEDAADAAREKFYQPDSDHITLLHVYNHWIAHIGDQKWCESNFVNSKALYKAKDVRDQLKQMIEKNGVKETSCGRDLTVLRKCITSCYFYNAARLKGQQYVNLRTGVQCLLHPTSALFSMGVKPNYVIYHELLLTSQSYMRCVTSIEGQWLSELGSVFFKSISLDNLGK